MEKRRSALERTTSQTEPTIRQFRGTAKAVTDLLSSSTPQQTAPSYAPEQVAQPFTLLPTRKHARLLQRKVVTFWSLRGGCSKSTLAATVAYCIAEKAKKVLLLDMDSSAPSLHGYLRREPHRSITRYLLTGDCSFSDTLETVRIRKVRLDFASVNDSPDRFAMGTLSLA